MNDRDFPRRKVVDWAGISPVGGTLPQFSTVRPKPAKTGLRCVCGGAVRGEKFRRLKAGGWTEVVVFRCAGCHKVSGEFIQGEGA